MYDAMDVTGIGMNPQQDASMAGAIYFVMFILVCCFLVMNLLVGAVRNKHSQPLSSMIH